MDNLELSKKIKEDILQKFDSIEYLLKERSNIKNRCMNDFLNKNADKTIDNIANQTLSDALLNSMATLVDYYFIYCALVIGVDVEKIRKVQYQNISRGQILDRNKYGCSINTLALFREEFNKEITEISQLSLNQLNSNDYWYCYLRETWQKILQKYGIKFSRELEFNSDRHRFIIPKELTHFHECVMPFYCNPVFNIGIKYNIYLDINNCLKHNTIPYVKYHLKEFVSPCEERVYELFEIKNYKTCFLKEGFLKDIALIDFQTIEMWLENKAKNGNNQMSDLENKWELGNILKIDTNNNGYINDNKESLYFFLNSILIIKTKNAIYVDANMSFEHTINELFRDISRGIKYLENQEIIQM